jgi:hypothetical protein
VVDSLKVLDPKRPIREADIQGGGLGKGSAGRSDLFAVVLLVLINWIIGSDPHIR